MSATILATMPEMRESQHLQSARLLMPVKKLIESEE
jgi:hypothetical protein